MTEEAIKKTEESFDLKKEALELLELINSEFQSDPGSVKCFDLRIVKRVRKLVNKKRKLEQEGFF